MLSLARPHTVFYKGNYLGWNGFTSQFPARRQAYGLKICELVVVRYDALGAYARELLYVPVPSPLHVRSLTPAVCDEIQSGVCSVWLLLYLVTMPISRKTSRCIQRQLVATATWLSSTCTLFSNLAGSTQTSSTNS